MKESLHNYQSQGFYYLKNSMFVINPFCEFIMNMYKADSRAMLIVGTASGHREETSKVMKGSALS